MTRRAVIVELSALRDIEEAWSWLVEREPEAAERWFNSIYDTIGSLEMFPERCPLAPESRFFNFDIREIFHGRRENKYRILFTINKNKVHVLHVRHGARLNLGETEIPGET